MNIDIVTEKNKAIEIAQSIGNPMVLPDYEELSTKVEHLYNYSMPLIETLHEICDTIYSNSGFDENNDLSYSMMSILYLINPKSTLTVFNEFLDSFEPAEKIISSNKELLGIDIREKQLNEEHEIIENYGMGFE